MDGAAAGPVRRRVCQRLVPGLQLLADDRLKLSCRDGAGQRDGEAAGISQAARVFKRCSKKGDVPPLWVSEDRHAPYVHDQHHLDRGVRSASSWCVVTTADGVIRTTTMGGGPQATAGRAP